jgi:general secretion pathway protein A
MQSMSIGQEAAASTGYEQFFGFVEPPFSLSVNTRFRFDSASHHEALSQVTYALERREPVVVVTGEIGTGKTMLCRTVVERLPRKTFLAVINDPMLGRDDLLKRILEDFGVISASAGARLVQTSRHELVHALEKFLASLAQLEAHAVVIIDEAQHVRPDVLEEIRLLANMQDSGGTLLQIVLAGQPSLRALLDTPELAQLRQRITRFISLDPLSNDEVNQYISHRLTVAREPHINSNVPGAQDFAAAIAEWNDSSWPVSFADDAVAAVARISCGVPRIVNLLCDRALETACAQQTRTVGLSHVEAAASLLKLPAGEKPIAAPASTDTAAVGGPASRFQRRLVAAAAGVAVVAAIVWIVDTMKTTRTAEQPAAATGSATPQHAPPSAAQSTAPPVVTPPRGPEPTRAEPAPVKQSPLPAPPITTTAGGESFEIVVASFRTEARAAEVARQVEALGQKVRQRSLEGWQQVLAGPFASRAAADAAQEQLDRAGFTETVIVQKNR